MLYRAASQGGSGHGDRSAALLAEAEALLRSLETTKTRCGYAQVANVTSGAYAVRR